MGRAEQRHIAIEQPRQQRCALAAAQGFGVGFQRRLHRVPVDDGRADMAQIGLDVVKQRLAGLGIGPVGLKIDQRRRLFTLDDRMKDAIGRNIVRSNCRSDRIDEKRHIVIGDRDPHDPTPAYIGPRFGEYCRALGMIECFLGKCRCRDFVGTRQTIGFAGQCPIC